MAEYAIGSIACVMEVRRHRSGYADSGVIEDGRMGRSDLA